MALLWMVLAVTAVTTDVDVGADIDGPNGPLAMELFEAWCGCSILTPFVWPICQGRRLQTEAALEERFRIMLLMLLWRRGEGVSCDCG